MALAQPLPAQPDSAGAHWWSLAPILRKPPPDDSGDWARSPLDCFVLDRLNKEGLTPSPEADRRTLVRRLSFDLHGLPPTPEEVAAFERDYAPNAYEKLVDRLLASPRYGERWGRHWLDVVHYGDTHGYDKDKPRPHAWPYRDYVVRAFNQDKPYGRFSAEQIAGDVLYPGSADGVLGLGMLAAGPWDFVGQVELREGSLDKKITRTLDRDDMVATVMSTFTSLTVHCARCHDHKFDPITQEEYYALQAVFAAVDRADRPFDKDPEIGSKRRQLHERVAKLQVSLQELQAQLQMHAGAELRQIEQSLTDLEKRPSTQPVAFGYHSQLATDPETTKWAQVDLGRVESIDRIVLAPCLDEFNGIGPGFGFPKRYRVELANDPECIQSQILFEYNKSDLPNPGTSPQTIAVHGKVGRYIRVTALKLAHRLATDYHFALAELLVLDSMGKNLALGGAVTALDTIEAPPRWRKANLVDGLYPGSKEPLEKQRGELVERRRYLLQRTVPAPLLAEFETTRSNLRAVQSDLAALPRESLVYAAATHFKPSGSFGPTLGQPRPVHLLQRGSEKSPKRVMTPGTLQCVRGLPGQFGVSAQADEGSSRAALAHWVSDTRNPLPWRSIVNRVWQYHFGQGLVDTPNDFGRMGSLPSHPELLDWLAAEFRDGGQSLKQLHRRILSSATYRQASAYNPTNAIRDGNNRLLWRMPRRKLEAEAMRDAVLSVAGRLDDTMGGPGFQPFGFKDDHSPHYAYEDHDPDAPGCARRSIYRFLVRSVPDPFMTTLDCADPSQIVERRTETLTALQALALLNNRFMVRMAEHLADRVGQTGDSVEVQIRAAYGMAFGRSPRPNEIRLLAELARRHGMSNVCRLLLNSNEFTFID